MRHLFLVISASSPLARAAPAAPTAVALGDRAWLDVTHRRVITAQDAPLHALSLDDGQQVWESEAHPTRVWLAGGGLVTLDRGTSLDDLAFTVRDPDTGAVRGTCRAAGGVPSAATELSVTATALATGLQFRWESFTTLPQHGGPGRTEHDTERFWAALACGGGELAIDPTGCTLAMERPTRGSACTSPRLENPRLRGDEIAGRTLTLDSSSRRREITITLVAREGDREVLRVPVGHLDLPPIPLP